MELFSQNLGKRWSDQVDDEEEILEFELNLNQEDEEIIAEDKSLIEDMKNYGYNPEKHLIIGKLLFQLNTSYSILQKSIKREDNFEAKPIKIHIPQKFEIFSDEIKKSFPRKIDCPPNQIIKLDFPYSNLSNENLKFIIDDENYPEKWNNKARIDLMLLRENIKGFVINKVTSNQTELINFYKYLLSKSNPSNRSSVFWKLSHSLMEHEMSSLRKFYTSGKEKIPNVVSDELSEETLRKSWVLDLVETINFKAKTSVNERKHSVKSIGSMMFHEGKRINVKVFPFGQVLAKIEIESEPEEIYIYKSRTLSFVYFQNKLNVGPGSMVDYLMTLADHSLTLSIIKDNIPFNEKRFVEYIESLLDIKDSIERTALASLYETNCLMMSDYTNVCAQMPVLDNLIETIKINPDKAEEIFSICYNSDPETMIKYSCINKTLTYAEVDYDLGISKYTRRTNRDLPVSASYITELRNILRMKLVLGCIKKMRKMPKFKFINADLRQELEIMVADGNYNERFVNNPNNYKDILFGKTLEVGEEINLQSRLIDKSCSTDNYNQSGMNSIKELLYYIEHEKISDPNDLFNFEEVERERIIKCLKRNELTIETLHTLTRIIEKEKEQKSAGRFYGVASFHLKLWISSIMEMVKRAMKLIPGQMMTMNEDDRRTKMYDMTSLLTDEGSYSLFLDYSGHNTSQKRENNLFIMEEIGALYGFEQESEELKKFCSILNVFENLDIVGESMYSDYVYYSKGQKGAIEGWLGPLWGIQSQLMLESMFMNFKVSEYIATSYSDDAFAVFKYKNVSTKVLNAMIERVQTSGLKMGLIVKLSQTQISKSRSSMLKNHYYNDMPIEHNLKKMTGISTNSSYLFGDDLELCKLADSGFTSSSEKASSNLLQSVIRNFRIIKVIIKDLLHLISQTDYSEDNRSITFRKHKDDNVKKFSRLNAKEILKRENVPNSPDLHPETTIITFNLKNKSFLSHILYFFYAPYTCYGYSLTPIPDALISGYSQSSVKRLSYLRMLLDENDQYSLTKLINLSTERLSYLSTPFPMTGGRYDTSTLLSDSLKRVLPKRIKNIEMKQIFNLVDSKKENKFKKNIMEPFLECYSSRIVSKYYEESVYGYINTFIKKIDNSTTFICMMGYRFIKLWNKAWTANHKIIIKNNKLNLKNKRERNLFNFDGLMDERREIGEKLSMNFLNIEEVPIMGNIETTTWNKMFEITTRGNKILTERGVKGLPPVRTSLNLPKYDSDSGISGLFKHKLIFQGLEITRFTKWIIMEIKKFSEITIREEFCLIRVCNFTLSTFSNSKYEDLEKFISPPIGGRFFHRANSSNFNPKTGDLSSHLVSSKYEILGISTMQYLLGGEDNNLNIQYLITSTRIILSLLNTSRKSLASYTLSDTIVNHIKDVTFNLSGIQKLEEEITPNNLLSKKYFMESGKIYKTYSEFIGCDDEDPDQFVAISEGFKLSDIKAETSFKIVYKYMMDQLITTPEIIADELLFQIIDNSERTFYDKDDFFNQFYNYYSSLNVIGKESNYGAIIRGLLYEEIFKKDEIGENWMAEMVKTGFSFTYRNNLLRLFIIACGLVYSVETTGANNFKLIINSDKTIENSKRALSKMKSGDYHFHIKDKSIQRTLIYGFPLMSYKIVEIECCAKDMIKELNHREFEQARFYEFFTDEIPKEIKKQENKFFGEVNYKILDLKESDISDIKGLRSAIRSYEYATSIACDVSVISSPTKSDIYPTAKGLIRTLIEEGILSMDDNIADVCGGRGDFHLALEEANLIHKSYSRLDGFNMINRMPGLVTKKANWNCFDKENYNSINFHNIFLIDISHATDYKSKLTNSITDLLNNDKVVILRINSIIGNAPRSFWELVKKCKSKIAVPDYNSLGIIYLILERNENDMISLDGPFLSENIEKGGFNNSLLLRQLVKNSLELMSKPVMPRFGLNIVDHTEEFITDNHILNEMLSPMKDEIIIVPDDLKRSVNNKVDLENLLCVGTWKKPDKYLLYDNLTYLSKGESGHKNFSEIIKEYKELGSTEFEVHCEKLSSFPPYIVYGFKESKQSELAEFLQEVSIMNIPMRHKSAWSLLYTLMNDERGISSKDLIDSVSIEAIKKNSTGKLVTNLFTTTKLVTELWKRNQIKLGMRIISGVHTNNLSGLLKVKTRTNTNNIKDFKLILNRVMRLAKDYRISNKTESGKLETIDFILKLRGEVASKEDRIRSEEELKNLELKYKDAIEYMNSDEFKSNPLNDLFNQSFIDSFKEEEENNLQKEEDRITDIMSKFLQLNDEIKNVEKEKTLEETLAELELFESEDPNLFRYDEY
nr:TPA_asm: polymerase [Viola ophiovirus]